MHGDPYCSFHDTNEDPRSCKVSQSQPDGACEWQCQGSEKVYVCTTKCQDFTCFCKSNYIRNAGGECVSNSQEYQCGDDFGSTSELPTETTVPTTTPEMHGDPYCVFFDTNEDPKSCKQGNGACEWQCHGTERIYVCDTKCPDFTCFCKQHYIRLEDGRCVEDSHECGVEYTTVTEYTTTPEWHYDPRCVFEDTNEDAKSCKSTAGGACEWQCHGAEKSYVCDQTCHDFTCFCKEHYIRLESGNCVEDSPEYQCGSVVSPKWEDCTTAQ